MTTHNAIPDGLGMQKSREKVMKFLGIALILCASASAFSAPHHPGPAHRPVVVVHHGPVVVVRPSRPVIVRPARPARPRPVVIVHPGPVVVYRPYPRPIYVRPIGRPDLSWRPTVDRYEATTYLGYTLLSDARDNDTVRLPGCETMANNYIHQMRLVVGRVGAEIEWVNVTFENGETDLLELNREFFAPGSASQWLDLRGGNRCVREIEILGDAESSGAQSEILFYGR